LADSIPRQRRRTARALLVAGSIAVALLAAAGLEAFASHRLGDTAWNIRGYRGRLLGRKEANEIRVAAIGGSTTFGFTVRTNETYPAYLETILNDRLGVRRLTASVANLGHLSDSSVCYEPTYQAYRDLDADVVILYEGYNDVSGGTRRTERDCYRQSSAIFRATGFFPVTPVYVREHWYKLRYGSIERGYEVTRAAEVQRRQAASAPSPSKPETAYDVYQRNVLAFVTARLAEGKGVVFASQPYLEDPKHLEQQTKIRAALEPFMTNPRFTYRSFLYLFGGKWDARWFNRQMWLNPQGNHVLAERIADAVMEVLPAGHERRETTKHTKNFEMFREFRLFVCFVPIQRWS
jgi:hypothetical protein